MRTLTHQAAVDGRAGGRLLELAAELGEDGAGTHAGLDLRRATVWFHDTCVPAAERHLRRCQKGGRRIERAKLIEVQNVKLPDGTRVRLPLYAAGGALGIQQLDDAGNRVYVRLDRVQTQRRGRKGRYRFYGVYRLPDEYHAAEVRVRLYGNQEDARRKLNRGSEPPGHPSR
jgi:hypothetical protein